MGEREVIETRGDFRAVIERDESPEAPDFEQQCAVIRFDVTRHSVDVEPKTPAAEAFKDAAARIFERYRYGVAPRYFERYLRMFHGTRDFRTFGYSYMPDSAVYAAFDTAAMREEWGCAEDYAEAAGGDAEAWQAYIDGDVYSVGVERRVIVHSVREYPDGTEKTVDSEEWEDADFFTGGFYGEDAAKEYAREALEGYPGNA